MSTQDKDFTRKFTGLFKEGQNPSEFLSGNFLSIAAAAPPEQEQTNSSFSVKWERYAHSTEKQALYEQQKRWYLELYGFTSEQALACFLKKREVILDAGCGLGYKAAWFAELAPHSLVVGVDYSTAAAQAAQTYSRLPNLFFMKADIASIPFRDGSVSYVSCDQVIQHTQDPDATFAELVRLTDPRAGEFSCYFYAKKALPRELLDEYFRTHCSAMTHQELWEMSEQLTELGRRLAELNAQIDVPSIPALGIKGGPCDVQRFLYWNFLKCFWNPELGQETSIVTNFDWYSPSNARRYSEEEVRALMALHRLSIQYFHSEEACYSGRFRREG